ncbi:MAG: hypothetical protein HC913_22750, partial [Microscillaceae bacterium]|nr:hypothetical protein [Microscillaceae bacterium]
MKYYVFTLLAAVALATCQPTEQKNNPPAEQGTLSEENKANDETQVIKPVFTT